MNFKVLKSGPDGIYGGESNFSDIKEALREIHYYKGWDSTESLHKSILKWSHKAAPGDVFCTQASAVVAVSLSMLEVEDDVCQSCGMGGMEYGEIDPVEGGHLEQEGSCPYCGYKWIDVFTLTERRVMSKKSKSNG